MYRTCFFKYVKVKSTILPESIIEYMKNEWKLQTPDLILSVTGSSRLYSLSPEVKKAFKIGLMKAVKSTGAWIITGGLDTGVMGLVGEAVADEMRTNQFVFMGITNWKDVKARGNSRFSLIVRVIHV